MLIYVITKEGGCTVGVLALRENKESAKRAAIDFAKLDRDNYHSYYVEEFDTNGFPDVVISELENPATDTCGTVIGWTRKDGEWVEL